MYRLNLLFTSTFIQVDFLILLSTFWKFSHYFYFLKSGIFGMYFSTFLKVAKWSTFDNTVGGSVLSTRKRHRWPWFKVAGLLPCHSDKQAIGYDDQLAPGRIVREIPLPRVGRIVRLEFFARNARGVCPVAEFFGWCVRGMSGGDCPHGKCPRKASVKNVRIPMHDYESLRVAVMKMY